MNPIRRLSYNNPLRSAMRGLRNELLGEQKGRTYYNSYSQAGEDRILSFLFSSIGIEHPTYIDVGAYKFDIGSNTYLFYLTGSRGVCIEPDPRIYQTLLDERPSDVCLNVAVDSKDVSEVELFLFSDPSLNTLMLEEAQRRDKVGEFALIGSLKVPAVRLGAIVKEYFSSVPDFISIDVEGADYEILETFDFDEYPVPVWVVETVEYSPSHIKPKSGRIQVLMKERKYSVYADTYINTIFVRNDWFHQQSTRI